MAAELERVDAQVEKEQRALERYVDKYAYGDISEKKLDKERARIQKNIAAQRARREELQASMGAQVDEDYLQDISYVLNDLVMYLEGKEDDPVIPVELVQDVYRELDLAVRIDAMDQEAKSAVLVNRLGTKNVLL